MDERRIGHRSRNAGTDTVSRALGQTIPAWVPTFRWSSADRQPQGRGSRTQLRRESTNRDRWRKSGGRMGGSYYFCEERAPVAVSACGSKKRCAAPSRPTQAGVRSPINSEMEWVSALCCRNLRLWLVDDERLTTGAADVNLSQERFDTLDGVLALTDWARSSAIGFGVVHCARRLGRGTARV
jgi:hypothetical protein